MRIRVLVADDHPIVRAGIAFLLRQAPDIDVVAEAAHGEEAVRLSAEFEPDVVLMDLNMPIMDGVAATAVIRRSQPATQVLVLTTYETDQHILSAVEAGAEGYVLKASPESEILRCVREVAAGRTALAPSVQRRVLQRVRDVRVDSGAGGSVDAGSVPGSGSGLGERALQARRDEPGLSKREIEVLRHVAGGLSNREIARQLYVSEATVKTHLVRAFDKLGVSDRTRAVMRAMELGVLHNHG